MPAASHRCRKPQLVHRAIQLFEPVQLGFELPHLLLERAIKGFYAYTRLPLPLRYLGGMYSIPHRELIGPLLAFDRFVGDLGFDLSTLSLPLYLYTCLTFILLAWHFILFPTLFLRNIIP